METLSREQVDFCGVQEHRFKGSLEPNQVRNLTVKDCKFKFFFRAQAGVMLAKNWAYKVTEVQHIPNRIILLKLIISKAVFTFLSVFTPQVDRTKPEKERFYDQLQCAVATETLIPVGDWNGHVGASAGVYSDAHGGHGFGTRNTEGERILEFAIANRLHVGNTWFKKRDTHLITYNSGGHLTQIDHILYRKSFGSAVSNGKVIPKQECVKQHYMVVCDFSAHIPMRKFSPRIRTWKLRDPTSASPFLQGENNDCCSCSCHRFWHMLILQIALSQLGQSWRAPCWMLPPKFVVSPRITSGKQTPGGGMERSTQLYKKSVHGSRSTVPWRKEALRRKPRGQNMLSGWQSLRRRKRNSPQYPKMMMAFFFIAKQMDHRIPNSSFLKFDNHYDHDTVLYS